MHLPSPIEDLIPKILQGKVTFVISNCIIDELEKIGNKVIDALKYAKQIKKIKCHHSTPVTPYECLLDIASI